MLFTITCGAILGVYSYAECSDSDDRNIDSPVSSHGQLGIDGRAAASTLGSREERSPSSASGNSDMAGASSILKRNPDGHGAPSSHRSAAREVSRADSARALSLGFILSELRRRQSSSRRNNVNNTEFETEEEPAEEEPEFASIRSYLTDVDEVPDNVRDVPDILEDPSNIIGDDSSVSLLAWDVREQAPRGSYLYVLQQDLENQISQVHRYFCRERRLDILVETCQPVASVYSDSGVPMAVGYTEDGLPLAIEADALDESLFSRSTSYVEANEYLFYLQEYLNSVRA